MRVVYFGTPQFSATILEYLLQKKIDIVAVVTRPDKPRGRSQKPLFSPVKELALAHHVPVYQPERSSHPEFVSFLATLQAELFIVAAYAEILKENVLATPPLGCINVHASVLPKYRGAAPIQRSIMEGEKETGVTIMKMAKELDAGEILKIAKTAILEEMTAGELTEVLAKLGAQALWETLLELKAGKIHGEKQDPALVTYAKKLHSQDGEISWNRPSQVVFNHIRGVTPKPGAWVWIHIKKEKKRLLIKRAQQEKNYPSGLPGNIISQHPKELVIACQEGAIRLIEVQIEGKKTLPIKELLNGISIINLEF